MEEAFLPAWHQALTYAVTGVRMEGLGRQPRPDLDVLTTLLRPRLGTDLDPAELLRPHPVPARPLRGHRRRPAVGGSGRAPPPARRTGPRRGGR